MRPRRIGNAGLKKLTIFGRRQLIIFSRNNQYRNAYFRQPLHDIKFIAGLKITVDSPGRADADFLAEELQHSGACFLRRSKFADHFDKSRVIIIDGFKNRRQNLESGTGSDQNAGAETGRIIQQELLGNGAAQAQPAGDCF